MNRPHLESADAIAAVGSGRWKSARPEIPWRTIKYL
jgi:hypothetical protein